MKKKTLFSIFGIILFLLIAGVLSYALRIAPPAAGFLARDVCNAHFVGGRSLDKIIAQDFVRLDDDLTHFSVDIDEATKKVTSSLGPFGKQTAIYREGYGCTLETERLAAVPELAPVTPKSWPQGNPADYGFDEQKLNAAFDDVFTDPLPNHRAILIVKDSHLIAERYAPSFSKATPMLSFSMHKSITGMMVGAAVAQGLIQLDDRPPLDEWADPKDPRHAITWRHLLQMQSGLKFQEVYTDLFADVPQMNIMEHSAGAYAAAKPSEFTPGTEWKYSTGTSNILQYALRHTLESVGKNYHTYARDEIFAPIGASSIQMMPDPSGTFIGGSYTYATARDWAKLGQLILQNGVWNNQRILPTDWLIFTQTPASDSDGMYGAQVWLNQKGAKGRAPFFPNIPEGAFFFSGWQGQVVLVIPEWNMVMVHLGRTPPNHEELDPVNMGFDKLLAAYQQE
ncbi:MAG: serine hydrolase [Bacteroidota bacterium]